MSRKNCRLSFEDFKKKFKRIKFKLYKVDTGELLYFNSTCGEYELTCSCIGLGEGEYFVGKEYEQIEINFAYLCIQDKNGITYSCNE